jgi:hypothetical protein
MAKVGSVVKEIKAMSAGFSSASFRHVKRYLNKPVHILAETCNLDSLGFISISAPDCIGILFVLIWFNQ